MKIHKCGPGCPPSHLTALANKVTVDKTASKRFTVDLHCHTLLPEVEALMAGRPEKQAERQTMLDEMGGPSVQHNGQSMLPNAGPKLVNLELRLQDMDQLGVDIQVLSPSPNQYYYWADHDLAKQSVSLQNEAIAHACATHPQRLLGLGNIALQHPKLAIKQLTYAVKELGLKGIEVSTNVNGLELADESFQAVWAKAEELGAIVFIHPFGTSLGSRLNKYYLNNTIGQPLETTIALSNLIYSGTLDRVPKLKVVAAHGGGYLPYAIGRSNHAYQVRPEASACKKSPEEYLKNIWFDTVVYEPHALRYLIDQYGISQLVVGTDYPFDMGDYDIHHLIDSVPGLSAQEREQILGINAAQLLNIPLPVKHSK